jgi:RNA polymerase sigma-70 factor, ECF subfamily
MDAGVSTAALDTLLGRVAQGDAEAFGTLYDRLAPQVWAAALAVSDGPGQAEALTEQVFVDMWRHSPDARGAPGCAQGWLLARANRTLRDADQVNAGRSRAGSAGLTVPPRPVGSPAGARPRVHPNR